MEEDNKNVEQQEKKEDTIQEKILEVVEESIHRTLEQGITTDNIDNLYKLVDIHKDMCNEIYWKVKESEVMRYDNYGGYSNYGGYDNYGREQYGEYGRRGGGSGRRYRGHEYMDGMYDGYSRYEEGREQYNRGNYNAKDDTMRSLQYMLESTADFFKMLKSEANSQEEMQMIREYAKKISEM